MKISFTSSVEDRERAVLPTIVYASASNEFARGFIIAIGWWKWGVRATFIRIKATPNRKDKVE